MALDDLNSDGLEATAMGGKITEDEHGVLLVPSEPSLAVVVGENSALWQAAQPMLDAAIVNAYADKRKVSWHLVETVEDELVGLNIGAEHVNTTSVVTSSATLFHLLGWSKAAQAIQMALYDTMDTGLVPLDAGVWCNGEKVSAEAFFEAVVASMSSDEEANQYDELADKFHEVFDDSADKTSEFAETAMEKARQQLTLAGRFTEEQGQKLKTFLENDFSRVTQEMKIGAKEKLNPSRLGAGALASMSKLLHVTGVALSSFAEKADGALACKSGEITSAGSLKCNACEYEMHFKKTGRIPPCPKCHKTEFTKGY